MKIMKKTVLIATLALTFCTGSMSAQAHGGYCYGPGFWPFIPLTLGLGIALSCAANADTYSSPVYAYRPLSDFRNSISGQAAETSFPTPAPQNPTWIPSTPGTGHWVPDPAPYSYTVSGETDTFSKPSSVVVTNRTTTITHSPGNVPVYVFTR
jgi:hypothetical protein